MASKAWSAPYTGKSSDHVSVIERGRAGCWSCDWAVPPRDGLVAYSRSKQVWLQLYVCIFPRDIRLYINSINHAGVCRSKFLADILLGSWSWDWGHNAVGSAALVYGVCLAGQGSWAICSAVWFARLPGGVCEGFNGPRLAPQAFKLKSFHDLYLLSRGAAWVIYTGFSNFKRTGTNRSATLSFIPVLGWKDKPILVSHLISASKKHHKRQIPLLLPCQDKLAKKAPLVRIHTTAFAAVCSVPPAHGYHHDLYKNNYKNSSVESPCY